LSETVVIVILNRNQAEYTRDCLASLRQIDYPSFRILVVDNGSTGDSLRQVAEKFPNVEFLWLEENLGVAGGRNAGLRRVLGSGEHPEYILFLDNDTLVAPDFLSQLMTRIETNPRIGAVQPKIFFTDPPNRICTVGGKLYPRISCYRHPGSGQLDSQLFQQAKEIDIVSGCAGLIRSAVFQEIGLLDETYSPYCHEDVDWSLRMRRAGYRLMMEPSAVIWHRFSSAPHTSAAKLEQLAKGHILFLRFHTAFYDLPASLFWVSFHMARRYLLPALARADWQAAASVLRGIVTGMRQKSYPIERVSVSDRPVPRKAAYAPSPSQGRKIFLVGVLGPFDSGPARVYETLLRSQFADHFQVRFLDLRFATSVADFERVRAAKFLRLVWYLWSTTYGLMRERYDALCIPLSTNRNAFLKDSLFAWLGFLFRVPVIILGHGTNYPALYDRSGRVVRWCMRATLKRTARCLVQAECLKFNFESFLPAKQVVSVYFGIDQLTAEDRRRLPRPSDEDRVTVLYLSALVQSKGILVVLESLSKVVKARKGIHFVVAGGWGRDSNEVKARAERWLSKDNLKGTVSFIGPVQGREKVRVLLEADIFVLPTVVDTAPLVLFEAMRAGLPIISTDVGAIPEIVVDGQNGLICGKGDADELAGKILYLAEHPVLRQQMSQNNLERFEDLFTTEKFASRMIGVFESVLAKTDKELKRVEVLETRAH
jgi:GT2 family glycosyltransferase/glycosyltransferase involved in cell wall biosynthesis